MGVKIESMSEKDLDQVCEIEKRVFPSPWSRGLFRRELDGSHSSLITAKLGSNVCGYAGLWYLFGVGHVTNLAVEPDFQKQGIGALLLANIMELAVSKGVQEMTLEVRQSNKAARRLYERFGFEPVGVRKKYYSETGEDALVLSKAAISSAETTASLARITEKLASRLDWEKPEGAGG